MAEVEFTIGHKEYRVGAADGEERLLQALEVAAEPTMQLEDWHIRVTEVPDCLVVGAPNRLMPNICREAASICLRRCHGADG